MARAFIGLGSNLGDGRKNLRAAWDRLGEISGVTLEALSSPYETAPLKIKTSHWFINAVGVVFTELQPHTLLSELLRIESEFGRNRAETKDRPVDLDLLYYDDLVSESADLVLPHPEIVNRLFVLIPLEELAPGFVHPVLGKTAGELRRGLVDSAQEIRKTTWNTNGECRASA